MPTDIEWDDDTWNPVTGCTKISAGCKNCYAAKMALRLQAMGQKNYVNGFKVACHDHMLDIPLKRKKPTRYFVNSMSDLFHDDVPFEFICKVFGVMAIADQHQFLILTKRPERMSEFCKSYQGQVFGAHPSAIAKSGREPDGFRRLPLHNVMLMVSVEDQPTADERIPLLLQTPAAKRGVSYEPALGPVDFDQAAHMPGPLQRICSAALDFRFCESLHLDIIIMGFESGIGARPGHPDWARGARDQCIESGTAFWFKQWGAYAPCAARNPGVVWVTQSGIILKPDSVYDKSEYPLTPMKKVGKKASGDLLDGKQYHEWPV